MTTIGMNPLCKVTTIGMNPLCKVTPPAIALLLK